MNQFFTNLFSPGELTNEITLFSGWHFMYIILIVGLSIGLAFLMKNKSEKAKNTTLAVLAICAIATYIADFFIMPLSQGKVDIDKLPFHICTLTSIFIPFAQFNKKFEKIKHVIVVFAVVSSLMYITYPGSALGGVNTFSYKVVQTFVFHGLCFSWGFMSLATGAVKLNIKKIWMELCGLVIIALWAALGNSVYSTPSSHFDWFFITGSTFPFIPSALMPFVVIAAVFGMCAIIYGLYYACCAIAKKIENKKNTPVLENAENK